MAKGQVSEEELTKGLKGIGNFGGLSAPRVLRDNPFRDSRTEATEPVKTIEVLPPARSKRVSKEGSAAVPRLEQKAAQRVPAETNAVEKERRGKGKGRSEEAGARKADIFTERVTLQISPEMRDDVERIARELQRAKVSKKERITGNTVMRVAIRLITKRFHMGIGVAPNDEEELFDFVEKVLTRG